MSLQPSAQSHPVAPPLSPLNAAEQIQAHGCGVWMLFGKCFPDAETRLGVSTSRNVCVSRRGHSPRPTSRLQLPPQAGWPSCSFTRTHTRARTQCHPQTPLHSLGAGPVTGEAPTLGCGAEPPFPGASESWKRKKMGQQGPADLGFVGVSLSVFFGHPLHASLPEASPPSRPIVQAPLTL
jgi:hypothetical protein